MEIVTAFILPLLAALVASLGWNLFGIYSQWRKTGSTKLNTQKLIKGIIIGIVIGIVAFGVQVVNDEDAIAEINSGNAFVIAVAAYFPFIVIVEKLFAQREAEISSKSKKK